MVLFPKIRGRVRQLACGALVILRNSLASTVRTNAGLALFVRQKMSGNPSLWLALGPLFADRICGLGLLASRRLWSL